MGRQDRAERRIFHLLLLLFVFSGAAGLIYEVVWLRMLIRAFGVTVYAVTTVLAVFMAGLAAGAIIAGRFSHRIRRPLLVYALLELGIGGSAWGATVLMGQLPALVRTIHSAAPGMPLAPLWFVAAAVLFLPSTVLMGATLPVLSGLLERRGGIGERRVGFLYAVNTLGAVLGVLASGFVLLGAVGERSTVLVAVAMNVFVGLLAFAATRRAGGVETDTVVEGQEASSRAPTSDADSVPGLSPRLLVIGYGLVGLIALSYQVVWSRLLILIVGNSVYGFSSMLAMYLMGIAAGSAVMSGWIRRVRDPALWVAALLAAGGLLSVLSLYILTGLGTSETRVEYIYSRIWEWRDFLVLPVYAFVVVFPVTFCSGALFPGFVRAYTRVRTGLPEAVGRLYGVNTVGAILGSLVTGFVLIGLLGSVVTLLVAALLSLALATLLLLRGAPGRGRRLTALAVWPLFLVLSVGALEDPILSILKARLPAGAEIKFHAEDVVAATTVVESGTRSVHINGLSVSAAGYIGRVFYVFVPAAFHPAPERYLALGMGAGNAMLGGLQVGFDTTIAELVPNVVRALPVSQPGLDESVLDDPRLHVELTDGRNFLLVTDKELDLIVVDASPPLFSSGTVNLYTVEFLELARARLRENGIMTIWVPLPCFKSDFWQIARNFTEVFPNVLVWRHPLSTDGALILGSAGDGVLFAAGSDALRARIAAMGLGEVDTAFLERWVGSGRLYSDAEVRAEAAAYPMVTDDRPYTEFPMFRFYTGETYHRTNAFLDR